MNMKKLETLEPDFRPQVETLLAAAESATGRKWGIVSGRRTMAEQKALYAQGRSSPGSIVTKAQPGQSAHNFGYAADLCPLNKAGDDFDWNAPDAVFKAMADIAVKDGLTAGYYFKSIHDAPHVEAPKWKQQQALWQAGKLEVA